MAETDLELPPITKSAIQHVDLTPDAGLAVRILRVYRQNCDCFWEVHGLTGKAKLVYDAMNGHQEQRAALLDAAIAKLGG